MAFLEDPRLRQRWNQISHNAETVTENAAANIWTFQHRYITPCLNSLANAAEACCITPCVGDREERARRRREHERAHGRAEYSFDFYDDWYAGYDDDHDRTGGILGGIVAGGGGGGDGGVGNGVGGGSSGGGGGGGGSGLFGRWAVEDWDRLLAGTGSSRRGEGEVVMEQPARKRGMRYGTRAAARRKGNEDDPTIIPSTQPIGFLGRLPFKIGGTLRYKPSAANLQEHPAQHHQHHHHHHRHHSSETQPLLGPDDFDDYGEDAGAEYSTYLEQSKAAAAAATTNTTTNTTTITTTAAAAATTTTTTTASRGGTGRGSGSGSAGDGAFRKRSGTTGSGTTTSDSFRSRGDLFPSDGEGDEDAIPLGDEFAVALDRMADDRSSARTRSSGEVGATKRSGESWSGRVSRAVSRSTIASPRRRWSLDADDDRNESAISISDGDDEDHHLVGVEKPAKDVLVVAPITAAAAAPGPKKTPSSPDTKPHDSTHHVEWGDHVRPGSPGSLFLPEFRSRISSPSPSPSPSPSSPLSSEEQRVQTGFVPARLPFFS